MSSSSDPLNNLLSVLGQTIVIVSLGIISRKFNWLPTDTSSLSIIVAKFALPAIFFLFSANMKIGSYNWLPIATVFITRIVMIILSGFISYIARFEPFFSCWGVLGIFLTQSNDIALGIPLINALWDNDATHFGDYAIIHSTLALLTTSLCIAFILIGESSKRLVKQQQNMNKISINIEHQQENDNNKCTNCSNVISNLLKNELLLAVFFGCITNIVCAKLGEPQLPLFFQCLLKSIAAPFNFLALLLMGIGMSGNISTSAFFGRNALFPIMLVVIKIILFPVVARAILTALYPSSGLEQSEFNDLQNFTFLYGSLPPAITSVVLAQSFNVMTERMTNGMMISLLFCAPYTFITCLILNMHSVQTHDILAQTVNTLSDTMGTLSIVTGILLLAACVFHKPWRRFPMSLICGLVWCQIMFSLCKMPCELRHDTRYIYYGNCFFRWASHSTFVLLSVLNALYRTRPRLIYNYLALWKIAAPCVVILVGAISVLIPVFSLNNNDKPHTNCWLLYQSQVDFTLIGSALFMLIILYTLSVSMYHQIFSARNAANKSNTSITLHEFHDQDAANGDDDDKNESLQEALLKSNGNENTAQIMSASTADLYALYAFHKQGLGIDFCYRLQSLIICELVRLVIVFVFIMYILDGVNLKPDESYYELHMIDTFIVDAQGFITFLAFCASEPFSVFIQKGAHFITCNAFRKTNILAEIVGPSKYTFE